MLFFENDYGYGAYPKVLEHLMETNMEAVSGYGNDKFRLGGRKNQKGVFLPGGTGLLPHRRHADQYGRHRHAAASV